LRLSSRASIFLTATIGTCWRPQFALGAQAIVTFNLDDFPDDKLAPYNVEAKHPDDFVLDAIDLAPGLVTSVVSDQAASLKNPPRTVGELLDTLRDQGLIRSVAKLRELFGAADPI
jgi:hypothetical protein